MVAPGQTPPEPHPAAEFAAVLRPHRSLGPQGFVVLMAVVAGINFIAGLAFLLRGAWPVFGFMGLDVLLIYVAFRLNYRSGRVHERVELFGHELRVRRVAPNGQSRTWSFEPYWVRVEIDDPPEHHSQLVLASHGRRLAIGSFLTVEERLDFARALQAALARQRAAGFGA